MFLPPEYVALFCGLAQQISGNTMLIPWEIWLDNFMRDATETVARSFWERLSPEPNHVNLDRLNLKRFYSLDILKSLIHCRQDKALRRGSFHPFMSSRLGTFRLLHMDEGHEVMFTRLGELATRSLKPAQIEG
jgi:hypothetical protein